MTGLKITTGRPVIEFPPKQAVTHRINVIARTGMGKTYAAKVLAEEFLKARLPFVIVDPMGHFWGLRLSATGKGKGFEVAILGGEHGDIPLTPTAGAEVANFVVAQPGHYILDLSGFDSDADQDRFAEGFASRMFRAKATDKRPVMLIVDEADMFAPEAGNRMKGQEKLLGAWKTLSRRGRGRGIGIMALTQRPAALSKHVLNQAEMMIVGQLTGKTDREAVDWWVRANATDEERAEFLKSLAVLERGEMWVWSPSWLRVFQRVRIRKAETFDSSKTPEPGDELPELKPLSERDRAALEKKLEATKEEAKATDPRELQKEVRRLKAELAKRPTEKAEPVEVPVERVVEVPVFKDGEVQGLERAVERLSDVGTKLTLAASGVMETAHSLGSIIYEAAKVQAETSERGKRSDRRGAPVRPVRRPPAPAQSRVASTGPPPEGEPSNYARGLLETMAAHHPMELTRSQIATLAGRSTRSSAFGEAMTEILRGGWAVKVGDLHQLTEAGLDVVGGDVPPLLEGEDLRRMWLSKLPGYESSLLEALMGAYPDELSREELAERTGRSITSSAFGEAISTLVKNRLASKGAGTVRASDDLFLETVS